LEKPFLAIEELGVLPAKIIEAPEKFPHFSCWQGQTPALEL
jgi:hypothetical protein